MLHIYFAKCILVTFTIFLLIATIQVGTAIYFSKSEIHPKPADLVVVFPGDNLRLDTGIQLIKDGLANNFMVISHTPENLNKLLTENNGPNKVNTLPGGKSRSTFEDVFQTVSVAKSNDVQSIIIVTSSYHLPRAMFLLKLFLTISGSDVTVQGFPVTSEQTIKLFSNEIVKFWGSLVEMGGCISTGRLPLDIPLAKKAQVMLKDNFIWKSPS